MALVESWKIKLSNIYNMTGKKTQTHSNAAETGPGALYSRVSDWCWIVQEHWSSVLLCLVLNFLFLMVLNTSMQLSCDSMGQCYCWWTSSFFCENSSALYSQSWRLINCPEKIDSFLFLHLKVSHQTSDRFVSWVPILCSLDLTWQSAECPSFLVCFWNNAVDRCNWKQHTAFGKGQGIKYPPT